MKIGKYTPKKPLGDSPALEISRIYFAPHRSLLLQGEDEPESSNLLFHGPDRESKSLLQTFHHLDQPENPENFCAEEHV